jgi:hypothetical protein
VPFGGFGGIGWVEDPRFHFLQCGTGIGTLRAIAIAAAPNTP